jgi:hypothetical protein
VRQFEPGEQARHGHGLTARRRREFIRGGRDGAGRVPGARHVVGAATHHELELALRLRAAGQVFGHITPGYATVCVEYVLVNRPFTTVVAVTKWPWPSSATSTVIVAVWPS